jgi:hypothetical protein
MASQEALLLGGAGEHIGAHSGGYGYGYGKSSSPLSPRRPGPPELALRFARSRAGLNLTTCSLGLLACRRRERAPGR